LFFAHHSQEDPFGYDESDLPLEKFCKEVDKQITAVAERAKIITFDLAYGPASHTPANRKSSYSIVPATASPSPPSSQRSSATGGNDDIEIGLSLETDRLLQGNRANYTPGG